MRARFPFPTFESKRRTRKVAMLLIVIPKPSARTLACILNVIMALRGISTNEATGRHEMTDEHIIHRLAKEFCHRRECIE